MKMFINNQNTNFKSCIMFKTKNLKPIILNSFYLFRQKFKAFLYAF